ncbi:helix-turn-helix domain-containing protein [Nocardia carnea]|uniref:helix-turn-helix domain-containing protein n=1 Tax=Nocardia carnea TaxID=37328 RepID=UPI00245777EF|nr:helix-turn-helix domain-containing protein [Nocardia carnea]
MSETWLTPEQLAEKWQISVREVQRMCARGRLAHMRIGRRIRISEQTVTDFQRAHMQRARSGAWR